MAAPESPLAEEPWQLHPIDQVILRLLYHPSLACGMDAAECEPLIRAIYY